MAAVVYILIGIAGYLSFGAKNQDFSVFVNRPALPGDKDLLMSIVKVFLLFTLPISF